MITDSPEVKFGTDGIRGVAGQHPLVPHTVRKIGSCIAQKYAKPGDTVYIAYDTRESSPEIAHKAGEGILETGANVADSGVLPTPAVAYLTQQSEAVAGIVITASHNPYPDNGLKVFNTDGGKLTDKDQDELSRRINGDEIERNRTGSHIDAPLNAGHYIDRILDVASFDLGRLRIGVDMANGATVTTAKTVLSALGAKIVPIFDKPNGRNINEGCGATNTQALQQLVLENGLDMGMAFDGDGDRVMLVDNLGKVLDGDDILYINAVLGREPAIVTTIMANLALEQTLIRQGIAVYRTPVGDRYVLDRQERVKVNLGGEQSGHIIFRDLMPSGDGLLAAIMTIGRVLQDGSTLEDWRENLQRVPQKLINIPIGDPKSVLSHPGVQELIKLAEAELGKTGRVNVRASGTEPLLRVMVESPDAEDRASKIAEQILAIIG